MSMVGQFIVTTVGRQMVDGAGINPKLVEWFEARGISLETLVTAGIYTGRHQQSGDSWKVVSDLTGAVVVFPYLRQDKVVNEKYRAAGKKFYQKPGGEKVFWNRDIFNDPLLASGEQALVITEGEMDGLSAIEAGYSWVVSVPDGAPPPRKGPIEDIDPDHDDKYGYIFNDWDSIKGIKRIIVATDADEPGKRLAEELVRRLGRVRCQFVEYPEGCKDLNAVLIQHGRDAVLEVIQAAKPYPVSGIYTYDDLPPEPDLVPLTTGWGQLNGLLMPFYPGFMVVTGNAGSGKSTWTNQLVAQLNLLHGVKAAIASFEMRVSPFVTNTLRATYQKFRKSHSTPDPINENLWLNRNFVFIAPEPGDENDSFDVDWLIEKAEAAVIRHGIRVLVVDPWNEIEHAVGKKENLTDYIGRAIRALKRFGREYECLIVCVAHPSKWSATRKQPEEVNLYDVSDSAHFANKADFGVVLARVGPDTNVMIKKIRYQPTSGTLGTAMFAFDGAIFS